MNRDGFLEMGPEPVDDETADALEQLPSLVRISVRLVPIDHADGDPWALVVGLEAVHGGPPHGLTTRAIFELVHRSLPRLERDCRRMWAAGR